MVDTNETTGIWEYSKLIMGVLMFLFLIALGFDAVLWYSVQQSHVAKQTLNEIIAAQPKAPKTNEDKASLLDAMAAAHKEAVAVVAAQSKNTTKDVSSSATAPTVVPTLSNDEKSKLLNSLH